MEPFVICDNLVKIHKVADLEVVALQGLDLEVAPGELLGIVGASGSGKTTLMNILGGLDRPSAGRVIVGGRDLLKLSDRALTEYRRTQTGFVWQQVSRNLVPYLSARDNVELPMILAGRAGRKARQRATELLEIVGLAERANHRLSELSGGEQQRIAIAVALANSPSLLLADEPTGELDSANALLVYQLFRELNQRYGLTTLIVSHDVNLARYVDRVVAIRDGRTAAETIRQVKTATVEGQEEGSGGTVEEEHFEEYAILDSAGRLQIPKEMRERYGLGERAELVPVEEGILIKPANRRGPVSAAVATGTESKAPLEGRRPGRRLLGLFRRR
jgi:putative ABC transport system ATP-binding protein